MIESTEISQPLNEPKPRNALGNYKARLYLLSDYRAKILCPACESTKVQEVLLIPRDRHGRFSAPSFLCILCGEHWPKEGYEQEFDRFLDADI